MFPQQTGNKPTGLYNKLNFKNRVNAVYNRHSRINLLSTVKIWDNQTKDMKPEPQPQEPTDEVVAESKAFADSIFKPGRAGKIDKYNEPEQINEYVITNKTLGRGAQGTVKLARDATRVYVSHRETQAIKILYCDRLKKKMFLRKDQLEEMLKVQVNIMRTLDHPNIIKLYEALYNEEYERLYLILEYCEKGSLLGFIKSKEAEVDTWPSSQARKICHDMASAVYYLHEKEIVHRDIKSENVLLDDKYVSKLCDFNISSVMKRGQLQPTSVFIGTKLYSPPELILKVHSKELYSPFQADIWSLGMTFLETIAKKHPFENKNLQELEQGLQKSIQIPETLPESARKLLQGMLKMSGPERLTMKEVMEHLWFRET